MVGKAAGGGPAGDKVEAHILIIEARYYEDLADEMAAGAIAEIEARGGTWERIGVPGALEIPQVVRAVSDTGRFSFQSDDEDGYDGVVAIGCVIRGETYHFEIVCNQSNHWLMEMATRHGVPVGNAILTVDTREQANERARGGRQGKGGDAARACLRLIEIERGLAEVGE
jgi:6,7-dimethyl-8-ribityllumazine synthase